MELYLLRPEEHHRLYGCINISVDEVPLEKRQHVTEGFITIVLAAIYYYVTSFFSLWDGSFAVVVPLLYIVFFILFFAKTHGIKSSEKISKQQKMMLLQAFVISLLNFITSFSFISMMYFVPAESFVILRSFAGYIYMVFRQ
uniref:Uncharacterized protein n=1 Tax=Ditylenchus dipsaci TaxID=166011 RepID=A0A915E673_9BILA